MKLWQLTSVFVSSQPNLFLSSQPNHLNHQNSFDSIAQITQDQSGCSVYCLKSIKLQEETHEEMLKRLPTKLYVNFEQDLLLLF